MIAASQIFSRDFDGDFFKLSPAIRSRIQSEIDRLGMTLDSHPHHRMKELEAGGEILGKSRVAVIPHPERKKEKPLIEAATKCLING